MWSHGDFAFCSLALFGHSACRSVTERFVFDASAIADNAWPNILLIVTDDQRADTVGDVDPNVDFKPRWEPSK
jgi:hypothetical protein